MVFRRRGERGEFHEGQGAEVIDRPARHEKIVEPDLGPVLTFGEHEELDLRPPLPEERCELAGGAVNVLVDPDVGVEGDVYSTAVERDGVPGLGITPHP